MKQKIRFIYNSLNKTIQMQEMVTELQDFDCWFSQIFVDFLLFRWLIENTHLASKTLLLGQFKVNSKTYCLENNLKMDYKAKLNYYDLVVYYSDSIIPDRMLQTNNLWVQEGMIDKYNTISKMAKKLHLPISY